MAALIPHLKIISSRVADTWRRALLSLSVLATLCVSACVSSNYHENAYKLPSSYHSAMTEVRERTEYINHLVSGSRFNRAETEVRILLNLSEHLESFKPTRNAETAGAHEEYTESVRDLARSAFWLDYYVRVRRKIDALSTLEKYAERYNFVTKNFGPGTAVSLAAERVAPRDVPETYRGLPASEKLYR